MFSVLKLVNVDKKYKNCTAVYPRPFTVKPVLWIEGAKRQQVMLGEAFAEVTIPVAQHWLFDPSLHRRVNVMSGIDNFFGECFPDGSKIGLAVEGNILTIKAELPRRRMSEEEFNEMTGQFFTETVRHNFGRAQAFAHLIAASPPVMIPDGASPEVAAATQASVARDLQELAERAIATLTPDA